MAAAEWRIVIVLSKERASYAMEKWEKVTAREALAVYFSDEPNEHLEMDHGFCFWALSQEDWSDFKISHLMVKP